jgi:LysR substrate binding domain
VHQRSRDPERQRRSAETVAPAGCASGTAARQQKPAERKSGRSAGRLTQKLASEYVRNPPDGRDRAHEHEQVGKRDPLDGAHACMEIPPEAWQRERHGARVELTHERTDADGANHVPVCAWALADPRRAARLSQQLPAQRPGLVRDGACELGAAHLPLPGDQLAAHPLGEQELLFVLPPAAAPSDGRPLGARELAETPLVLSPPGTSTRMLLAQALAAVGVTPQIAVQTAAREAIVPLVLAGAGAALLPAPLAREAQRRGAIVRSARPAITRTVGLIHRQGPLSAAARSFLALTTDDA